ncbi:uncharacterized protein [Periplaneta americana]|uniref:uncharacterized protein n=1 Tax=Periplaneta americana TaxID=6978 RepID=UPI0037E75B2D
MNLWYVVITAVSLNLGMADELDRDARWLLRMSATTKVVVEQRIITETKPSSCVVVASSLPPCRQLDIMPTKPTQIVQTRAASLDAVTEDSVLSPSVEERAATTETQDWGEYFGLRRPTVTDTVLRNKTSVYLDPSIVVTFSIVGCQPSQLPFELEQCKAEP